MELGNIKRQFPNFVNGIYIFFSKDNIIKSYLCVTFLKSTTIKKLIR